MICILCGGTGTIKARDGIEAQNGLNDVWAGDLYPCTCGLPDRRKPPVESPAPLGHDWIKSTHGHGETMCRYCLMTNREGAEQSASAMPPSGGSYPRAKRKHCHQDFTTPLSPQLLGNTTHYCSIY